MAFLTGLVRRSPVRVEPDGNTPPRERAAAEMTMRKQEERLRILQAKVEGRR